MDTTNEARHNHLLAALPAKDLKRWLPELEAVDMPLGQVLYEAGTQLSHVYFPTTAVVSLLYVMRDGDSAEIAVVGNDGLVGISLLMPTQDAADLVKSIAEKVKGVQSVDVSSLKVEG